jgi:hydroxymethylbilane synthase
MNVPVKLIIGSRGSKLALFQANWAKTELERNHPSLAVEIRIIKTSGDLFTQEPLNKIGGKGLFTKEIEEALLRREIDLAVHSLKDLPTELPPGLRLGAVSAREDARDAFLSTQYASLAFLPPGARVGTSSLRRQSQLLFHYPGLEILNLRGNLDTRIRKLEEGHYDGILLACAGLVRLKMENKIRERIAVETICPAIGQAALAIEIRREDEAVQFRIDCLNAEKSFLATAAERSLLHSLGGGCHVPIAGHAVWEHGKIKLTGVVASPDGSNLYRETAEAIDEEAVCLGKTVADQLLRAGAGQIIASLTLE